MSCDEHVIGDSLEWGQSGMETVWNGDITGQKCNDSLVQVTPLFPSLPPSLPPSQALDRLGFQAPPLKTNMECISSHRTLRLPGSVYLLANNFKLEFRTLKADLHVSFSFEGLITT